jgi:hypothetical protein
MIIVNRMPWIAYMSSWDWVCHYTDYMSSWDSVFCKVLRYVIVRSNVFRWRTYFGMEYVAMIFSIYYRGMECVIVGLSTWHRGTEHVSSWDCMFVSLGTCGLLQGWCTADNVASAVIILGNIYVECSYYYYYYYYCCVFILRNRVGYAQTTWSHE